MIMKANWERLYSVLKMTREGKDNEPIDNPWYVNQIKSEISIKDIEEMNAKDVKEAVINYLQVIVPGIRIR